MTYNELVENVCGLLFEILKRHHPQTMPHRTGDNTISLRYGRAAEVEVTASRAGSGVDIYATVYKNRRVDVRLITGTDYLIATYHNDLVLRTRAVELCVNHVVSMCTRNEYMLISEELGLGAREEE